MTCRACGKTDSKRVHGFFDDKVLCCGRDCLNSAAQHLKAELKRADLTYDELATGLKKHGFTETKASVANKLARATHTAHFFLLHWRRSDARMGTKCLN